MEESAVVRDGLLAFYERFSSGDPEAFATGIADVPGLLTQIGAVPAPQERRGPTSAATRSRR
jgi:hypothetical protein